MELAHIALLVTIVIFLIGLLWKVHDSSVSRDGNLHSRLNDEILPSLSAHKLDVSEKFQQYLPAQVVTNMLQSEVRSQREISDLRFKALQEHVDGQFRVVLEKISDVAGQLSDRRKNGAP